MTTGTKVPATASKAMVKAQEQHSAAVETIGALTLLPRTVLREKMTPEQLREAWDAASAVNAAAVDTGMSVQWNLALIFAKGLSTWEGSQGDYATTLSVSAGYATRLKRLGVAIERYAFLAPGTQEWRALCAVAQTARGGILIPGKDEDALGTKEFRAALKDLITELSENGGKPKPVGSRKARPKAGLPDEDTPDEDTPSEETDEDTDTSNTARGGATPDTTPTPAVSSVGDIKRVLHNVFEACNSLSADDWAQVEDAMTKGITSQVDKRRVLAEAAARKAKATPATVAATVTKATDKAE